MSSRGRAAQLGSSSLRKSYACSSRALLLGAGWSTAEVKTRTGQDAPALALLDRRNSPSFHKVSKSELKGFPLHKIISRYDGPSKLTERESMLVSFLGLSFGSSPFLCRCVKRSLKRSCRSWGRKRTLPQRP